MTFCDNCGNMGAKYRIVLTDYTLTGEHMLTRTLCVVDACSKCVDLLKTYTIGVLRDFKKWRPPGVEEVVRNESLEPVCEGDSGYDGRPGRVAPDFNVEQR